MPILNSVLANQPNGNQSPGTGGIKWKPIGTLILIRIPKIQSHQNFNREKSFPGFQNKVILMVKVLNLKINGKTKRSSPRAFAERKL